ncbi:hypothetical protein F5884DRAFT_814465 [Xylogone sp. PMI_703]|nr:hypothetical protein F5884DRAFT_814465 [Xylogone sp. PMI_703]
MNTTEWYGIFWGGLFGLLLVLQVRRLLIMSTCLRSRFRKYFVYRLVPPGRYRITVLQAVLLISYAGLNVAFMLLDIRSGMLASINFVPLFLGGRTSFIAEWLDVSLNTYYLAHHWIGRLVFIQGLVHSIKSPRSRDQWREASGITLMILVSLIFVSSFRPVRQFKFEVFLKVHFILATLAVGALLWHVLPGTLFQILYPSAAIFFWLLNKLHQLYQVRTRGTFGNAELEKIFFPSTAEATGKRLIAYKLSVKPARQRVRPGEYYYVRFPKAPFRYRIQTHPFLVAWWDNEEDNPGAATKLTFFIQPRNGLSSIIHQISTQSVNLNGPYGKSLKLKRYHTVILAADGIGIAGILSYAKYLLERKRYSSLIEDEVKIHKEQLKGGHSDAPKIIEKALKKHGFASEPYIAKYNQYLQNIKKVKKRLEELCMKRYDNITKKVDIFWLLQENSQEHLVASQLQYLQDTDLKEILQVWCLYPEKMQTRPSFKVKDGWACFYLNTSNNGESVQMSDVDSLSEKYNKGGLFEICSKDGLFENAISDEIRCGGRSIVVACGTAQFTHNIRTTVSKQISTKSSVEFEEVEFRPWDSRHHLEHAQTPAYDAWRTEIQPPNLTKHTEKQQGEMQSYQNQTDELDLDGPGISRMSDSEEENKPQLKSIRHGRPEICVIEKRGEHSVHMDVTDFV